MFFQNMLIAAEQVAILYIMAAIGVIADKAGVFTESTARKCTDLLFTVITPAKILQSFFTLEYSISALKGLFISIGGGILMHLVVGAVMVPLFNKNAPEKTSVYKFAAMFGNCGYMGLPLVDAVVGKEGVFYMSAIIISFQIFNFTYGVWVMNKGRENGAKIDIKKIIINPGVLPVFVGLPVFMLSIKVPGIILTPVSAISGMNSPLAMLMFGTYISNTDFRTVFRDKKIPFVALFKLILMPLAMLAALKLFGIGGALGTTLLIASATPSANNTIMFAAKYERDTSLASQTVAIVSLLSIITLPIMIALY